MKGNGDIMKLVPRNYYLDDLLDSFLSTEDDNKMKCDIYEKDGKYHIEMDVPGFQKNEIKIECNKGNIVITAEKKAEEKDEHKKYIRKERTYGKYQRSFYLGDIKEDEIEAKFENGILNIVVPKVDKEATKKYIEVK